MIVFKLRIKFCAKSIRPGIWIMVLTFIIISCLNSKPAFADSTGTIAGTVLDIEEKTPMPGAIVRIINTDMGAVVNPINGSFRISNIPPGIYTLTVESIGYQKSAVNDIKVMADSVVKIDFELISEGPIFMGKYSVADPTSSINIHEINFIIRVPSREIEKLPVTNLEGILKSQGVIVNRSGAIHIRGSRAGDVAFIDDGVFIRDELGGH